MPKSIDIQPQAWSNASVYLSARRQVTVPMPTPQDHDLSGRVAIITGGNSGLGLEAGRQLLRLGLTRLIVAARSQARGAAAAKELKSEYADADVQVWPLEMTSYKSVQDFVRRVEIELPRLDIAILCAGVLLTEFTVCEETGHEETIQTHYLSTVLLGSLLLPILKDKSPAGQPGRLTVVGSSTALSADWKNLTKRPILSSYDNPSILRWNFRTRYAESKLLLLLWLLKIAQEHPISEDDVIVNIVDPGLVNGTLLHARMHGAIGFFFGLLKAAVGRTVEAGASTIVDAAVIKDKESHECFLSGFQNAAFPLFSTTQEGKDIVDELWKETWAELQFADAKEKLQPMRTRANN